MEKDVDEMGKIARAVKAKLQAINKDIMLQFLLLVQTTFL